MLLMSHKDAKVLANSLDEEALRELIKKAVMGEGQVGSTTVIPILFFRFVERFGVSSANELAAWACSHTENQYVPFGTRATNAKDYRQFILEQDTKKIVRSENEAKDQLVHAEKQKQKRLANQRHIDLKNEADISRTKLLKAISKLTPVERIQKIIEIDVPLESVPFDQLEITEDIVKSLGFALNLKLIGMIGYRKKGPWVQVRQWLIVACT